MQLHQQKGMISLSPPTICNSAHKKASLLQKVSKGLTVGSVITGSTFLHGPPVLALGFTKLFKKSKKVDETNIQLANSWIGVNNHLIEKVLPNLKWDMGIGSSTALFGESGG
ncbi:hypothetical protein [Morganella morganii]|uniref:hypothetical protein n=1 Tax=Morganella morganii TaxID=582 RepID=UPI00296EA606|nr:hypothetical protein [Morganella morganii]WOZ89772.1 hypothetical protein PSP90_07725 [Morganella morganii]